MSNCLVVLSGGVNSTISAAIAKYVYFDNPEDKIHGISLETEDVFIGVGQTDSSGYSDCHRDFIDELEKTIKLVVYWPIKGIWYPNSFDV